ncbi:MAG: FG-GAP-like repeat-containing protein [Phycisphaerales bacterium JB065]
MSRRHQGMVALVVCAAAACEPVLRADPPPIPFTQEAVYRGIDFSVRPLTSSIFGYGVGLADLNNSGALDLIALGDAGNAIRIWENDGSGFFTERSLSPGLDDQIPAALYSGVSAADFDNDGDLDLYLSVYGAPDVLLRNDGDWNWTNVTQSAGLGDTGAGCGLAWMDFNRDGWLDLYLANRTGTYFSGTGPATQNNRLYRNNGDGTFTDVAPEMGVDSPGSPSFQGNFLDYNGDGLVDLYLANDKGNSGCTYPSRLYRNDGTTFTDVSEETNAFLCIDGMTVTIGDLNNDLRQDIYVTNVYDGNSLLVAQPDGTFLDLAADTGTISASYGWASQFLDVENDGYLELYVCNTGGPNELFSHDGVFPCNDMAGLYGVAGGSTDFTFCAATGDLNNDGAMDLVVSSPGRPLSVYINNDGAQRDWLKVRVLSEHAPRDAYNATVTVVSNLGTFRREIIPNSGYKTQNDMHAHFGLGDDAVIEEVRVRWTSGTETVLTDMLPNQTLVVTSPCLADLDSNGQVDLADLNAILARYGQPVATMAPGDLNANGEIDFDDLTTLLALFGTSPCGN